MNDNANYTFRDQLARGRVARALRTMKSFPNFDSDLQTFVQDEARRQADIVLEEKDLSRPEFKLENMRKFKYKDQLDKFQRTNPLLLSVIIGTISKQKVAKSDFGDISRKGFGGPNSAIDIDLIPTGKQSKLLIYYQKIRTPQTVPIITMKRA